MSEREILPCGEGVLVPIPDWMAPLIFEFDANHPEYGINEQGERCLRLDACIVPAIIALWDAGIPTLSCCCGHGGGCGTISLPTCGRRNAPRKRQECCIGNLAENDTPNCSYRNPTRGCPVHDDAAPRLGNCADVPQERNAPRKGQECDCHKYEHQVCDICQRVTGDKKDAAPPSLPDRIRAVADDYTNHHYRRTLRELADEAEGEGHGP